MAAAIGFLLLLPLQHSAGLRQQKAVGSAQIQRIVGAEQRLAQPLPLLKAQVNAVLDQAQIQINRDRSALQRASPATALPELLRNGLSCLLLATAYAALARRPGSDLSLLQDIQQRLQGFGRLRSSRSGTSSQVDYLRQLSGKKE